MEIRMDFAGGVDRLGLGVAHDDLVTQRGDGGDGGVSRGEQEVSGDAVDVFIRDGPAGQIDRGRSGVVNLDPVGMGAVSREQAGVVLGLELIEVRVGARKQGARFERLARAASRAKTRSRRARLRWRRPTAPHRDYSGLYASPD